MPARPFASALRGAIALSVAFLSAWSVLDPWADDPTGRAGLPPKLARQEAVPARAAAPGPAERLSSSLSQDAMPLRPVLLRGSPERAQAVIFALLQQGLTPTLERELATMGLLVEPRDGGLGLREAAEPPIGLGGYLLRPAGAPVLLQAPHRDTDLDTGRILDLLVAEGAFAAAWNTVSRSVEVEGRRAGADLAHAPVSFFNAFGLAFAEVHPEGLVVQIHGHARERRQSPEGRLASVIVSSGTQEPSVQARAVAACLAARLPEEAVRLFPEEVRELGATTNANGRALRAAGFSGFVHLELSRELRRRLVAEADLRARLAACLHPP